MIKNDTSDGLNPIPKCFPKLWDVWDIRVCILASLGLQTFLILFGSLRKRSSSKLTIYLIWSAYLLADWVPAFVLGLIFNNNDDDSPASAMTEDLQAFWAPFLLLHLGGPDTITAFALEDNELWVRHLFGLVLQFSAAGYMFLQTLPDNNLWIATSLMFLAALIKYAERTLSLYRASLGRIRESSRYTDPDPDHKYAKLFAEYSSMTEANLPVRIVMTTEPEASSNDHHIEMQTIGNKEMVHRAYDFIQTFKELLVDKMIFSLQYWINSRDYFLRRTAEDAFEVVEIELSFIYEVLYTKSVVVHSGRGFVFRIVAFSSTLISLLLFLSHKKLHLPEFDVIITYMLLIGAMILDVIALVMLIFSDWTVLAEKRSRVNNIIAVIATKVPIPRTPRWSEHLSQFNLIRYSLSKTQELVDRVLAKSGLEGFALEIQYKSDEPVTRGLKEFIFGKLKEKSMKAKDAKETSSARGGWVLGCSNYCKLLCWSVEVDYDESLLLWHIATEIFYQTNMNDESHSTDTRRFSKLLSDYMLYLLLLQPSMMLNVRGIERIRFRDTCAVARAIYREQQPIGYKDACDKLFNVDTTIKPTNRSVLCGAVRLAKELKTIAKKETKEKVWELISQVWLELLCYAAIQCRANIHAEQVSKGGELLTFVWLMMTHLCMTGQFKFENPVIEKLIVEK